MAKNPSMKTLILLFSVLSSTFALADCYDQITLQGQLSSRVFKLTTDEFPEYDKLNPKMAALVVDTLLRRETSCNMKTAQMNEAKISCVKMPISGVTCEVPTNIGYFIVHRNSFGSFDHSIMYARWD